MSEVSLKEKTAKGLLWGGFSNGIQQLLNLFFGIFLARLLTPDDYGMVGMLTIFSTLAGTLQESGFTAALANKRHITHDDYNAVFWYSLFMGITLYSLLFFSAPFIARFYHQPQLIPLARYVFLGFLISCTATAHHAYLFRNLMVKQKTQAQVPALLLSGIVGVAMAYHGMSYWGIATQSLVFIATVNLSFWYYSPWRPTLPKNFRPLKEMFGFSNKILITNIFIQMNNNLLSALMGRFFPASEVGYYTQSNKWNTMGHSLVSGTLTSVAQPVLAEVASQPQRQLHVLRKMLRFTAFLAFPTMLGLALISHELILITITDKWLPCVPILQALCMWGAVVPINTLFSNLLISKGKSNIYMWNVIFLNLTQLGLILLSYPYGIQSMIQGIVCLNIGWLFVWQYFVWKEIRLSLWYTLKDILPFALITVFCLSATWIVTHEINNIYLRLFAKIFTASILYILWMWGTKSVIFKEILQFILPKSGLVKK